MIEGEKDDQDKNRLELLPPEALEGTARVLTFGAKRYGERNWEKGIKYGRIYGALTRHMLAWWKGEDLDPETGESHLHHAGCCIAFLQTYHERGIKRLDNRPIKRKRIKRLDNRPIKRKRRNRK